MAKVGKLTKLKSAIKRWPSFTNKHNHTTTVTTTTTTVATTNSKGEEKLSENLHAVYVGKSRRRYLLRSDIICHPLFQELIIDRSDDQVVSVACEVVLFEHLLWMLENSGTHQLGSTQELVEFYSTY